MTNMLCRTKENANPRGKSRVYFTCHPMDFAQCFEKVCIDIFKTHDCAIYYMEDMLLMIQDQDLDTDLGSNNLFVIPVTENLLTRPNRAMDVDLPYALRKHIPVLPIMMEPGLDDLYKKSYKFGQTQYLNPYSTDRTEVPYGEKLKNYLESVLVGAQQVKRIREAFDTYLFLSYRKKDRRHANELMRAIHRNPECWDIAVWYDEFLTPGESFQDSIQRILHDSKLFVLLVTPNLLEEPEGKPNFVMGQEYPAARKAGVAILPVEMEPTDPAMLREKYPGIPDCVSIRDEAAFQQRLLAAVRQLSKPDNNEDPEHMFLIGLAYLEGIDVEVDRERGEALITAAAEADYPDAMVKLHEINTAPDRAADQRRQAGKWALRLAQYCAKEYGGAHEQVLYWMQQLVADRLAGEGEQGETITLAENIYFVKRKLCGEDHPDTISALSQLASVHRHCNHPRIAKTMLRKILALCKSQYEDTDPKTVQAMRELADICGDPAAWDWWADKEKITRERIALYTKVLSFYREELGQTHEQTAEVLAQLAACYSGLQGCEEKAVAAHEMLYDLRKEVLGEKHPDAIAALEELAFSYGRADNRLKKLELLAEAYLLRCEVDGEDHPDTCAVLRQIYWNEPTETDSVTLLIKLGEEFREYRERDMAYRVFEQAYKIKRGKLGETHPDSLAALEVFAKACYDLRYAERAAWQYSRLYELRSKVLGQTHPDTIDAVVRMAKCYKDLSENRLALDWFSQAYELQCAAWGEENVRTISILKERARIHSELGNLKIARMQYGHILALCEKVYGEAHYITQSARLDLEMAEEDMDMELDLPYRRQRKVCQHCGGRFVGLLRKKCEDCERPKDY